MLTVCYDLQQGDPIEERYREHMDRENIVNQLVYCINSYREAAASNESKFEHIDISEKQKVLYAFFSAVLHIFCLDDQLICRILSG